MSLQLSVTYFVSTYLLGSQTLWVVSIVLWRHIVDCSLKVSRLQ